MEMTDRQRAWWFATHPEYSRDHKGSKRGGGAHADKGSSKIRAGDVDAYVDNALKHLTGHEAALVNSIKKHFGTQAQVDKQAQHSPGSMMSGREADERSGKSRHSYPASDKALANMIHKLSGLPEEDWMYFSNLTAGGGALPWILRIIKTLRKIKAGKKFIRPSKSSRTKVPRRLPRKGTPEYRKIEAARKKGIRLKKKEELENIKAGGKGSGVWSEKELESLRNGGDWPKDAQWHHDPTVANRPDLAADPKSVHPLRGGRERHLRNGHDYDWRKPYK